MTVANSTAKSGPYIAAGVSGTFDRTFRVLDEDHVRVIRSRGGVETQLTTGIGHTGIGDATGTVVISTGLQAGDTVVLLRAVPNRQDSDYSSQGSVSPEQIERDLDLLAMQSQEAAERLGRALSVAPSHVGPIPTLVVQPQRASRVLMFGADGETIEAGGTAIEWERIGDLIGGLESIATWLTPQQFGARGDGVADDTAAVQQAINAASARPTGAGVYLPTGTYRITSQVNIPKVPGGSWNVLRGEGHNSTILCDGSGARIALWCGHDTDQGGGLRWRLTGFRIRGNGVGSVTGVYLKRTNGIDIDRLAFENVHNCFMVDNTYGHRITQCHAVGVTGDFIRLPVRTFGMTVDKNSVFNVTGYFINFVDTAPNKNILCTGNDVEGAGGLIKSAGAIDALSFRGNYFEVATGKLFDFAQPVRGEIAANELQMFSAVNGEVSNFFGTFSQNSLYNSDISWAANSYPLAVAGNTGSGTWSVAAKRLFLPALAAAYQNTGGAYQPAYYTKDTSGRVHIGGNLVRDAVAVPSVTFPYTLFTLGDGFRPAAGETFVTQGTTTGTAKIRVAANGNVIIESSATADIGLAGISFQAAGG